MSSYLFLSLASVFEVVWVICLEKSYGFNRGWPTLFAVFFMLLTLFFLAKASQGLSVVMAYSVWVGLGTLGTALVQHYWFNHPLAFSSWIYLLLLVISIAGLQQNFHHSN